MVTSELMTGDSTDHMDEVATVQVFETILVRIMHVGMAVEIHRRRIFTTILVTSVLWKYSVPRKGINIKEDLHGVLLR